MATAGILIFLSVYLGLKHERYVQDRDITANHSEFAWLKKKVKQVHLLFMFSLVATALYVIACYFGH